MANDDTPVYVHRIVQTIDSGGLVCCKLVQTEELVMNDISVFTEDIISESLHQDVRPHAWCQTLICTS